MNHNRYCYALTVCGFALALGACGSPNYHSVNEEQGIGANDPSSPTTYKGTESGSMAPDGYRETGNGTAAEGTYHGTRAGSAAPDSRDAAINEDVINALSSTAGIRASDIRVGTMNGVVSLRGTVASQTDARSAVQAARQVRGVQRVDYDLQVR